jgi:nitrite reductase (NADH) small subunit
MRRRVATLADLPEHVGWLIEVDGREIALFREGGRVHALDNVCPHRGAALSFGEVRNGVVFCPLHAWPFEIASGRCTDLEGVTVDTFPVVVEGGEVFLEL